MENININEIYNKQQERMLFLRNNGNYEKNDSFELLKNVISNQTNNKLNFNDIKNLIEASNNRIEELENKVINGLLNNYQQMTKELKIQKNKMEGLNFYENDKIKNNAITMIGEPLHKLDKLKKAIITYDNGETRRNFCDFKPTEIKDIKKTLNQVKYLLEMSGNSIIELEKIRIKAVEERLEKMQSLKITSNSIIEKFENFINEYKENIYDMTKFKQLEDMSMSR